MEGGQERICIFSGVAGWEERHGLPYLVLVTLPVFLLPSAVSGGGGPRSPSWLSAGYLVPINYSCPPGRTNQTPDWKYVEVQLAQQLLISTTSRAVHRGDVP